MNPNLTEYPVTVVELSNGAVFGVRTLGWEGLHSLGVLTEEHRVALQAFHRFKEAGVLPTSAELLAWIGLLEHIVRAALADEESFLIFETLMSRGGLGLHDYDVLGGAVVGRDAEAME